jgi:hypothetical protein
LAKACGISIVALRPLLHPDQSAACHPGKVIARAGEDTPKAMVLLTGWACYQRISQNGRRQIFGFILPGDLMGCWSAKRRMEADIVAITPLTVLKAAEFSCAVQQREGYAVTPSSVVVGNTMVWA